MPFGSRRWLAEGALLYPSTVASSFPRLFESEGKIVRFWLRELFRRWAGLAALLQSNALQAAAQFTCCPVPAEFYLLDIPIPSGADDPHVQVHLSPRVEVDIDGLWLVGDSAE